jgi:hypothetical protein
VALEEVLDALLDGEVRVAKGEIGGRLQLLRGWL